MSPLAGGAPGIQKADARVTQADVDAAAWLLASVCERTGAVATAVRDPKVHTPRERRARREWFVAMWASGWPYKHIERVTGFDHTTVMYAVRKELAA